MKSIVLLTAMATGNFSAKAHTGSGKILVVYYSWSGNTAQVGNLIREATGADLFVIEPVEPYPTDYDSCTQEAKRETEAGAKRPIRRKVNDFDAYDTVFVGTPNWWSTLAPPVLTFLTEHDLSGKTLIPFVTHGGGREGRCFTDMRNAAPGATLLRGLALSGSRAGSAGSDVERWLVDLGVKAID